MIFGPYLQPVELYSPLPKADCTARLKPLIASWMRFVPTEPLRGFSGADWLRVRINTPYNMFKRGSNPFQTVLRARLLDEGIGTRISCRFGIPVVTAVPYIAGLGFLAVSFLAVLLQSPLDWATLGLIAALTAIGLGFAAASRYMAWREREQLLKLLRDTLQAQEADWPAAGPLGPVSNQ